jgi:hypothetical protein
MPENDGDAEQRTLFPIRSDLAVIKEGAGALKVETVLDEIAKLEQLRALGLPEDLFWDVPAKLVTEYRQHAGIEWPRELWRHPLAVRYTLLAALCWQREREILAARDPGSGICRSAIMRSATCSAPRANS